MFLHTRVVSSAAAHSFRSETLCVVSLTHCWHCCYCLCSACVSIITNAQAQSAVYSNKSLSQNNPNIIVQAIITQHSWNNLSALVSIVGLIVIVLPEMKLQYSASYTKGYCQHNLVIRIGWWTAQGKQLSTTTIIPHLWSCLLNQQATYLMTYNATLLIYPTSDVELLLLLYYGRCNIWWIRIITVETLIFCVYQKTISKVTVSINTSVCIGNKALVLTVTQYEGENGSQSDLSCWSVKMESRSS